MQRTIISLIAGCFASFASCSKKEPLANVATPAPPQQNLPAADSKPAIDACTLLTSAEIESVQGQPVQDTKPSVQSFGGLAISQCYFTLTAQSNSVVLTVTQSAGGGNAVEVKKSWEQMLRGSESERKDGKEEKEKKPLKIEGIGDAAFWSGSHVGGAIYVLKGDSYIRISVGGPGDSEAKIDKSKKLGQAVLNRL